MPAPFIAIESFLDPIYAANVWPESIANSKVFLEQILQRAKLNKILEGMIVCLPEPDMSLGAAINQGYVTEEQVAEVYMSLSVLLESGPDYRRLVLYLPFEFLPNKTWHSFGKKFQEALNRFRQTYMEAWKRLLSAHDVRANFIDGDVLEEEQRTADFPRVVKAAHLIPKLIENGLMEAKDAITLMEESDDQVLRDSIADALSAMGFNERRVKTTIMPDIDNVTKKRHIWLEQMKKQKVIDALSKDVSVAILENKLADKNITSPQVLIEGIRKAIESAAKADFKKARALYRQYDGILLKFWESKDFDIRETLLKAFRRLRQLRIVNDEQLAELNIANPRLAGPFSENLKSMNEEMDAIRGMASSIKSNSELSQLIYPVVLVFGSRLNGYGSQGADIDISVFVKPEMSFSNRAKLQSLLRKTFAHEKVRGDEIIEFWLEEKEGKLLVRDFTEQDVSLGQSYWTHILFGGAWEGDKDAINELCEKLLVSYMCDTGEIIKGRDARSLYIEDIEQSTLQYRLMHKGYERFFPPHGGIHTPHVDEIDSESMFWDSGYRQLATRLFVSRVFLPKIPINKN